MYIWQSFMEVIKDKAGSEFYNPTSSTIIFKITTWKFQLSGGSWMPSC